MFPAGSWSAMAATSPPSEKVAIVVADDGGWRWRQPNRRRDAQRVGSSRTVMRDRSSTSRNGKLVTLLLLLPSSDVG